MNSLHGFNADNFMSQLPAVLLDDERMNALAYAIAKALATRLDELPLAEIYTRIDALPEALLDILARDFSIDWYNYDSSIEAKRNLIKSNYYVHRHLGTSGAVKSAVLAAFAESAVEEWFEYSGNPYHFRVRVGTHGPFTLQQFSELLRIIDWSKRHSAHLESVIVKSNPVEIPIRIGVTGSIITRLAPVEQSDNLSAAHTVYIGGAAQTIVRAAPTEQPDNLSASHTVYMGGQAQTITRRAPAAQQNAPPKPRTVRTGGTGTVVTVLRGREI